MSILVFFKLSATAFKCVTSLADSADGGQDVAKVVRATGQCLSVQMVYTEGELDSRSDQS